ncbi:type II toxin-antitoxin system death-on-curing family toxin [soil metagenome]
MLHAYLLELFGGATGLRDEGALESALMRPQNLYAHESADVFKLAAAYASGIVKNHPFVDGNKRTGLAISLTFLEENGFRTDLGEADAVPMTVALAAGELDEAGFAKWLEDNSVIVEESNSP